MRRRLFTLSLLVFPLIAVAQTRPKATTAPKPTADAQLYRSASFGFRFQIPYGWVNRTQEMRNQNTTKHPDVSTEKPETTDKPATENAAAKGEVLLAIFERPPDAIGETVNSAVVIASESAAAYPGLKKAEDYVSPLTELAISKGFKPEGDPNVIEIDSHPLVRADFNKPLNDKLTMRQSTLILLAKGQIISFTFIGGSEDEVDNLIEGLHFGAAKPQH